MSENWNKSYSRINWKNYPNEETPLNETNLNLMDSSLNVVDNRILTLDTIKLDLDTANTMVKDVTLNSLTGVITITFLNGTTRTYDTKLEKLAVNFSYDSQNQRLVITLDDGTKQYVDLSSLITEYEFTDTSTIDFSVSNGSVSAIVKDGSITGSKLQPNYLADIQAVGRQASADATLSKSYAVGGTSSRAGEDTDNSKYYKEQAQIAASASLRPQGSITFAQLPNSPQANDMYKITDDFTTDSRFEEPGKDVKGGTFIYYNGTKWVLFVNASMSESIPGGGSTGQVLAKASNTDYDTEWINQSGGGVTPSHVGQIIHSTTLNTLAKVQAIYGSNTTWISLSGYVLRGATSGVTANNNSKDLGSDTHTITEAEMPSHRHSVDRAQLAESAGYHNHSTEIGYSGGSSLGAAYTAGWGYVDRRCSTEHAGAHTHYIAAHNTNYTGSGSAMSIIPNEKNVYIWERIA